MGENPSVSFVLTQTSFGTKCVIFKGQKYRFSRKTASNLLTFRCAHKYCTSQVLTDPDNTKIVDVQGDHSHSNISNSDVGQNNTFKNKNELWDAISKEINDKFHGKRTSDQFKNKFLNIHQKISKRPKLLEEEMINFQDEIKAFDFLGDIIKEDIEESKICELEVQGREITNPEAALSQMLSKYLIEVAKINAHAQERKHREYMDNIKSLEAQIMNNVSKVLNKLE